MSRAIIAAVGDVITGFDDPAQSFVHVREALRSADLRFAQAERSYSERGHFQEQAGSKHGKQHPRMAEAFKTVPFDVVSVASNHTGDWGPEAVEDTIKTFEGLGIATIGTGPNISEARKPVIFERNGLRIAFLGYVSTTPPQYWATESRAGSVPMRAHTFYEPYEFQPGSPARVVTLPHLADLDALLDDVRRARQESDLVFVSLHWGVHYVARPCDYQITVAHAAIDAGAAAILGHHAHQPQGVELYKNSVIFYSIGNFANYRAGGHRAGSGFCLPNKEYRETDVYSVEPDPGFVFNYRRHFDEGGIVFIEADRSGIMKATYQPTLMNATGQPEIVRPGQPQFEKSLDYLNWAGKFISGGITGIQASGDRYQVHVR